MEIIVFSSASLVFRCKPVLSIDYIHLFLSFPDDLFPADLSSLPISANLSSAVTLT